MGVFKFLNFFIRFSKSFFLYIASVIPPTWILELENIRLKQTALESQKKTSAAPKNSSILSALSSDLQATTISTNSLSDQRYQNNSFLSNQSSNYYDYDLEIPVEIPDLPDDLKV